jgi:hypothetical protein
MASRTKAQKNRDRIKRRRDEMQCQLVSLQHLTPKVMVDLDQEPHPKIANSKLTKLDYVEWLLANRYHFKAWQVLQPYSSKYQEPFDKEAYAKIQREHEDYGVPRTYR